MFHNWILIKRGESSTISLGFSEKLHIFSKRKIHREKYIINNTFHSWHMYNSYWISKNYDSSGQCNGSTVHNGATFLAKSHFIFFAHITQWFSLKCILSTIFNKLKDHPFITWSQFKVFRTPSPLFLLLVLKSGNEQQLPFYFHKIEKMGRRPLKKMFHEITDVWKFNFLRIWPHCGY